MVVRTAAVLLAAALALPLVAIAAREDGKTETRRLHADHVDHKPLRVDTENGGIAVSSSAAGSGQEVSITAKVRAQTDDRLKATAIVVMRLSDGTLDVHVKWPDNKRRNNEGVSFDITLPNLRDADLHSANGSITLVGSEGLTKLTTSNGPITARRIDGPVHADTSNGAISIEGAAGEIAANTTNGRITIADSAGPVRADTSNGAIDISLRPTSTGPVHADTSNGAITLNVGASFAGTLAASTSNAHVGVEASAAKVKSGKDSTRVQFAAAGPNSELQSSNGEIKITQR